MRFIIILAIIAGAGYFWHQNKTRLEEFESLKTAARTAASDLERKEKEREKVMEKLDPLRRAKADAESKGTSVEQLQQEVAALQDELNTATAQLDAAEAEFVREMESVRAYAKTKTLPAIKLTGGEELLEARITKFGEGYVSISHKEGVKKVPADDLPEGWAERYSLNYVPREAEADKEAISAKVEEVTLSDAQIKALKVSEVEEKIRVLEVQLLALSHQVRDKSRRADQLVREAYKVALRKGARGDTAIAKRTQMFSEATQQEKEREVIRAQYRRIRDQKAVLEKQRNQLKYQRHS